MKDKVIGETSAFAVASLFSSLFAIVPLFSACCSSPFSVILPSVFAIVFGIIALRDIKIKKFKGKIYAVSGIILGILEISIVILGIIGIFE